MQVGDLVKYKRYGDMGVITEVNKRDLSFYKSHTYLVQFVGWSVGFWLQDFEMEVVCK
jgi:hypothetical protein